MIPANPVGLRRAVNSADSLIFVSLVDVLQYISISATNLLAHLKSILGHS